MINANSIGKVVSKFRKTPFEDKRDAAFDGAEPTTDEELQELFESGELTVSYNPEKTVEDYEAENWDAGRDQYLLDHPEEDED